MSRLGKGYLISTIGVVFWSSTAIFISLLIGRYNMPPLQLAFWRDLLVSAALFPAIFIIRRSLLRVEKRHMPLYVLYGLVLAGFNAIWTLSVRLNGAAAATVMAYGSAGFTALLAWWLFKESLNLPKIAAVIFSLGGCVLVANAYDPAVWRNDPMAIAVGLLSGLLFAGYTLVGKEASRRKINSWSGLLFSFACAAVILLLLNFIPGMPGTALEMTGKVQILPSLPLAGWGLLVVLAFMPTILGYGLYIVSMDYLPASIANLIATLEPTFTALQAYVILGDRMTLIQIIGSVLVIAGVVIVRLAEEWGTLRQSGAAGGIEPAHTD